MKILIADDDSGFALILRATLTKMGHNVTVAKNGDEAWATLQRETFSLVISDWMMPGMEGPALCWKIRAQENASYTYIILLTSRSEHQDRVDGLYSGADDFLAKPLEHGELAARLEIAQRILTMQETLQRKNTQMTETVAALARSTVELERRAERERNIATQLQSALTPSIPRQIPGMALTRYYEAALEEAQVGGDFYDVFPIEKGCTALVVGDVSGKGIAAATQVAMVRNMLRYALHRSRTLVGALQSLNTLLAEQQLLTGFATLFVARYDSGAGRLTYVNCGQEPALVRRAGGGVDHLIQTGPVLGSFVDAAYEERTVMLGPGDALAIFTDGLTEVGGSRAEMLGIEGVAYLLEKTAVPEDAENAEAVAEHLALGLIAAVDAAVQGNAVHDDMCLLLGVVT